MQNCKWLLAFPVCLSVYALTVCFQDTFSSALAQTTTYKAVTKEKEGLFALVNTLEKRLPFDDQFVTKSIGRPLISCSDSDKQNLYRYTKPDSTKLLWQVHLRKPVKFTKDDNGSLLLELNPNMRCITHEQIIKRYGSESSIEEQPSKATSANSLMLNYDYERPWGTLTFQILKKEPHYLTSINLDARTPIFPCGGIVNEQDY